MKIHNNSHLFRLTSKLLKYFLLALFGLANAYVLSLSFGTLNIAATLLIVPLGIALLSLVAVVIIVKSLR
jgi:predicted histidine transporter YuiF (NhaC family)